jgi:hypothetical protein
MNLRTKRTPLVSLEYPGAIGGAAAALDPSFGKTGPRLVSRSRRAEGDPRKYPRRTARPLPTGLRRALAAASGVGCGSHRVPCRRMVVRALVDLLALAGGGRSSGTPSHHLLPKHCDAARKPLCHSDKSPHQHMLRHHEAWFCDVRRGCHSRYSSPRELERTNGPPGLARNPEGAQNCVAGTPHRVAVTPQVGVEAGARMRPAGGPPLMRAPQDALLGMRSGHYAHATAAAWATTPPARPLCGAKL